MGAMQANADWDRFNGILAGATAALAYTELLPHRDIMIEPFCRGIPPREAAAAAKYYPALVALFTLLLRLSADTAAAALTQIRVLFEETDRRLADGRRYLQGDRLTLGDIALASAAAPVLLPENSASPIPPFPAMPYTLRAVITEMRQYRTGAFVLRLFAEDFVGGDIRQTPSEP
jgi:glutathione S-transferase